MVGDWWRHRVWPAAGHDDGVCRRQSRAEKPGADAARELADLHAASLSEAVDALLSGLASTGDATARGVMTLRRDRRGEDARNSLLHLVHCHRANALLLHHDAGLQPATEALRLVVDDLVAVPGGNQTPGRSRAPKTQTQGTPMQAARCFGPSPAPGRRLRVRRQPPTHAASACLQDSAWGRASPAQRSRRLRRHPARPRRPERAPDSCRRVAQAARASSPSPSHSPASCIPGARRSKACPQAAREPAAPLPSRLRSDAGPSWRGLQDGRPQAPTMPLASRSASDS